MGPIEIVSVACVTDNSKIGTDYLIVWTFMLLVTSSYIRLVNKFDYFQLFIFKANCSESKCDKFRFGPVNWFESWTAPSLKSRSALPTPKYNINFYPPSTRCHIISTVWFWHDCNRLLNKVNSFAPFLFPKLSKT